MSTDDRQQRLAAELEALRALKKASSVLDFEFTGDPPNRYTFTFRGRGIARNTSPRGDVEYVQEHNVDLRLPFSFPDRPPDIRWTTPLFHPNVSFSGFINLDEIGLSWSRDLGLDVVCERLWDVGRAAYMNLESATNYSAKNWYEDVNTLSLPIDPRPLRDKSAPSGSNVVRYERRGDRRVSLPQAEPADILFIGDDTPTPALPRIVRPSLSDDDDILYIGD